MVSSRFAAGHACILAWAALGFTCVSSAQEPTTQPTYPATPSVSTAPAQLVTPLDRAVERILDRLERKGNQIKDIQADIEYIKIDPILEDRQKFTGILLFKQDKPNPRFLIRFDKFEQEGIVRKTKEWHEFDGQWYTEARERTKSIIRRQIVQPGEDIEVFRLGQGPFPLPFGQKKDEIRRHCAVQLILPAKGDPPNTDHLECTPLPGTEMDRKYGTVHFYIDRRLNLPVRVRTVEKAEGNEILATFEKIRINQGLSGSATNIPDLPNYSISTEPFRTSPPK